MSDQSVHMSSLIRAFASRLKLSYILTEYHLELLSLKGGCKGLSESTLVKMHFVGNHMSRFKFDKEVDETSDQTLGLLEPPWLSANVC